MRTANDVLQSYRVVVVKCRLYQAGDVERLHVAGDLGRRKRLAVHRGDAMPQKTVMEMGAPAEQELGREVRTAEAAGHLAVARGHEVEHRERRKAAKVAERGVAG